MASTHDSGTSSEQSAGEGQEGIEGLGKVLGSGCTLGELAANISLYNIQPPAWAKKITIERDIKMAH